MPKICESSAALFGVSVTALLLKIFSFARSARCAGVTISAYLEFVKISFVTNCANWYKVSLVGVFCSDKYRTYTSSNFLLSTPKTFAMSCLVRKRLTLFWLVKFEKRSTFETISPDTLSAKFLFGNTSFCKKVTKSSSEISCASTSL